MPFFHKSDFKFFTASNLCFNKVWYIFWNSQLDLPHYLVFEFMNEPATFIFNPEYVYSVTFLI